MDIILDGYTDVVEKPSTTHSTSDKTFFSLTDKKIRLYWYMNSYPVSIQWTGHDIKSFSSKVHQIKCQLRKSSLISCFSIGQCRQAGDTRLQLGSAASDETLGKSLRMYNTPNR